MTVRDQLRDTMGLCWLLVACWALSASEACDKGWFGPKCKYQCHCANTACEIGTSCLKCERGWFGPDCQFVDLAYTKVQQTNIDKVVIDGDDTTCISPEILTKSADLILDKDYPLIWFRVHVNKSDILHNFKFETSYRIQCPNMRNVTVDDHTLDIYCDAGKSFKRLILKGEAVAYLCSVYISGGRNVALRQTVTQSTTYNENTRYTGGKNVEFAASRAVDGNTSQDFYNSNSCSSTKEQKSFPTFNVTFSLPKWIHSYQIYFRYSDGWDRKGFVLVFFDKNNTQVFNFTNVYHDWKTEYIFPAEMLVRPISLVSIEARNRKNILTFCEVQLFGDSVCETGQFGRDCEHTCHCANGEACFVSTGACPSGCAPGYSGMSCDQLAETSTSALPVVGVVVGVVLVLLVVVVVVVVVRALRRWKKSKSDDQPVHAMNTSYDNGAKAGSESALIEVGLHTPTTARYIPQAPAAAAKRSKNTEKKRDNDETLVEYCNLACDQTTTSLSIDELADFVKARDRAFFQSQFNKIPANESATLSVGLSPENIHKNRYKNISAYDHSRVHLIPNVDKKHEDYINASYIEDNSSGQTFIASQGPSKLTLADFVRMLWEQEVDKVVMLTNLVEQGKQKCEQYWPEDDEMKIGEITVSLATTQVFADYVIRRLQLRKAEGPARNLTQFHFTAWPDKDVPGGPWGLVDFEQRVACYPTNKPIVVHCSAGVGRTGTFIALRNLMKQAEDTGRVDFFTAVQKLRHNRIYMVQTLDQYIFLHKATFVAFICIGTTVTTKDVQHINQSSSTKSDLTKTEAEFKAICRAHDNLLDDRPADEDYPSDKEMNQNSQKNRFSSILPNGLYRPILQCEDPSLGAYINAVLVSSFTKRDQQILTQLPLPETIVDFWRLVIQYKVTLIVAFEGDLKSTDPTIGTYLPAADCQPATFSVLKLRTEPVEAKLFWKQDTVYLTVDKDQVNTMYAMTNLDDHNLTHLTCTTTDLDPGFVLALIEQIRSLQSRHKGRILYTCRNGATYSGLVCVLSLLLDRMDNDLRLTVPLVVGAIKAVRPEVIPTLDQYRLLYQVLHLYSENMSDYSNFGS